MSPKTTPNAPNVNAAIPVLRAAAPRGLLPAPAASAVAGFSPGGIRQQYDARDQRHAGYFFTPVPPTDGAASREADDADLRSLVRLYLANRGVWESGWWLGPTISVEHTAADVDTYLGVFAELLASLH